MSIKGWVAVGAIILVMGAAAVHLGRQAATFERRATSAEAYVAADTVRLRSLKLALDAAVKISLHRDTVAHAAQAKIAAVDSASHPDSTCTKSLAVRDSALTATEQDADGWFQAYLDEGILADSIAAERDTLAKALKSRPPIVVNTKAFEVFQAPALHVSLQAMLYPERRIGIGVSYDLYRIPIHVHFLGF